MFVLAYSAVIVNAKWVEPRIHDLLPALNLLYLIKEQICLSVSGQPGFEFIIYLLCGRTIVLHGVKAVRSPGTLCSFFSLSIIIFSIVDFPQWRTPVSILTNGVFTYAMILSAYIGLSIICNTSIAIIYYFATKNQHFCGYKSQKCSTRIILADYVRLFAAFFCCFSFFMQFF